MKITIVFDDKTGHFSLESDASNVNVLGILEIAKFSIIKQNLGRGGGFAEQVRRVGVEP